MSENRGDAPPTGNTPSELRDMLAQTMKEQAEEPASAADQSADGGQPPADTGEPGERTPPERGADGRFLPSGGRDGSDGGTPRQAPGADGPGGEPPPAKDAPAAKTPPAPAAGPATSGPPASGPPRAPDHWSAEDRELFGSLSSDADRDKFLKLNARREAGLTPRLQRAADLERDGYSELDPLFQPFREQLKAQNRRPGDVIKIWYDVERGLTDKATQDEIIANLIHGYGANPVNIARHLNARRGFANPQPGPGDGNGSGNGSGNGQAQPNGGYPPGVQGGQTAVADPVLAARLERLENADRLRLEAENRASLDAASRAYHSFADARDADGNLSHPFLAEVESQMTTLAQLDRAQGKSAIDLQDLYDRAIWADPSTRERLLANRQENEARKAAEERKAKADAARRAGSSVTGSPGPGQAPLDLGAPDRSIRDEIRAQMEGGRR